MLRAAIRGLATYVPGVNYLHRRCTHTGGSDSASYCYAVWLRHLVSSHKHGLCHAVPRRVAELGPGDSIGMGIAALLSGAEMYYGLDALPLANLSRNLTVLDGLVALFRERARIPDFDFPHELIEFDESRVPKVRDSILNAGASSMIRYVAPWWESCRIERGTINMIFSTSVLEHVEDLSVTYQAMREWLAPNGWISNQIDFRCHGIARDWNAHWMYEDWLWRLLRGRRLFFLNRQPHSTHMQLMSEAGFSVVVNRIAEGPALPRERLAARFRNLSDADLTTSGAFIQARLT